MIHLTKWLFVVTALLSGCATTSSPLLPSPIKEISPVPENAEPGFIPGATLFKASTWCSAARPDIAGNRRGIAGKLPRYRWWRSARRAKAKRLSDSIHCHCPWHTCIRPNEPELRIAHIGRAILGFGEQWAGTTGHTLAIRHNINWKQINFSQGIRYNDSKPSCL